MSTLKIHGPIRIRSMQTGITKWKEGSFEIVEKENKVSLVVHYNTGGIPRIFQVLPNFDMEIDLELHSLVNSCSIH